MTMRDSKWDLSEQANFLKDTGDLLKRGYPISEAIESVTFRTSEKRKKQLRAALGMLKDGLSFNDVLEKLNFHPDLVGYVFFAEEHGNLAEAIHEGSKLLLKRDQDLKRLLKLLYYPILLFCMTFLLLIFVQRTLLPRFTSLFITMNLKENIFTTLLFVLSDMMPFIATSVLFIVVSMTVYYHLHFKQLPTLTQKNLIASVPYIGNFFKLLYTHYFSVQLSYLLSGGLSVYEALKLFERNETQKLYVEIGSEIKKKLVRGERLEDILGDFRVFDRDLSRIIRHGQQNGKLEQELYFFSLHCVSVLETKIDKNLRILQPLLYSFIGILILCIYLAILLPMFHLMDGI